MAIAGNTAQDSDSDPSTPVGAWVIGPSLWCVDYGPNLTYSVNVSNVSCGLPNT
jgi:hypothetical protein